MRRSISTLGLALMLAAGAAAGEPAPRPRVWIPGIPDVMQSNSWSCGVGVVQAIAQRFDVWGYHDEWAEELGTSPEEGTHPAAIVETLRAYEMEARLVEGMTLDALRAHIDAGDLVIVDYQAWGEPAGKDYSTEWEDGHYSIAVGYSEEHLFLEDPSLLGSVGYLTFEDFASRWHDYENEGGERREYRNMAIVVPAGPDHPPAFLPIE